MLLDTYIQVFWALMENHLWRCTYERDLFVVRETAAEHKRKNVIWKAATHFSFCVLCAHLSCRKYVLSLLCKSAENKICYYFVRTASANANEQKTHGERGGWQKQKRISSIGILKFIMNNNKPRCHMRNRSCVLKNSIQTSIPCIPGVQKNLLLSFTGEKFRDY